MCIDRRGNSHVTHYCEISPVSTLILRIVHVTIPEPVSYYELLCVQRCKDAVYPTSGSQYFEIDQLWFAKNALLARAGSSAPSNPLRGSGYHDLERCISASINRLQENRLQASLAKERSFLVPQKPMVLEDCTATFKSKIVSDAVSQQPDNTALSRPAKFFKRLFAFLRSP
jgi:hypothetical protein